LAQADTTHRHLQHPPRVGTRVGQVIVSVLQYQKYTLHNAAGVRNGAESFKDSCNYTKSSLPRTECANIESHAQRGPRTRVCSGGKSNKYNAQTLPRCARNKEYTRSIKALEGHMVSSS